MREVNLPGEEGNRTNNYISLSKAHSLASHRITTVARTLVADLGHRCSARALCPTFQATALRPSKLRPNYSASSATMATPSRSHLIQGHLRFRPSSARSRSPLHLLRCCGGALLSQAWGRPCSRWVVKAGVRLAAFSIGRLTRSRSPDKQPLVLCRVPVR